MLYLPISKLYVTQNAEIHNARLPFIISLNCKALIILRFSYSNSRQLTTKLPFPLHFSEKWQYRIFHLKFSEATKGFFLIGFFCFRGKNNRYYWIQWYICGRDRLPVIICDVFPTLCGQRQEAYAIQQSAYTSYSSFLSKQTILKISKGFDIIINFTYFR